MSESKVHKIEPLNKTPGEISKGANTEILLDWKPLSGVWKVKHAVGATGVGTLNVENLVDFMIVQDVGSYKTTVIQSVPETKKNEP